MSVPASSESKRPLPPTLAWILRFIKTRGLKPSALVLAIYGLLLLARYADTLITSRENEYLTVVLLQLVIFALPAAVYYRLSMLSRPVSLDYLRTLPRPLHIPMLIFAATALISGGALITLALSDGTDTAFSLYNTFISKNDGSAANVVYLVLAYAVLPAVCEELVFRWLLPAGYERYGSLWGVLFGSLFFTMLHFDFSQFFLYFYAGILLSLLLYATRSLLCTVIVHFCYNIFCLFGQPYVTAFYNATGSAALFVFLLTVILLLSLALFAGQAARIYRARAAGNLPTPYPKATLRDIKKVLVENLFLPTTAGCVIIYIIASILIKN